MKNRLTSLLASLGLLCLAPAMASASSIDFNFSSNGTLHKASCGFACYTITASGTALTSDVPGTPSWTFTGYMTFYGSPSLGVTDPMSPTGWSFLDDTGSNNLYGTFGWVFLPPPDEDSAPLDMAFYTVAGGSGLFAGATGNGSSLLSISQWYSCLPTFDEVGTMHVITPATAVPEPGATSLVAAGLLMLGFVACRRRRVDLTRR